jgi:hypothetical protein
VLRAPQLRRGFGDPCLNAVPGKTDSSFTGDRCFAPAGHRVNDSLDCPLRNSMDGNGAKCLPAFRPSFSKIHPGRKT